MRPRFARVLALTFLAALPLGSPPSAIAQQPIAEYTMIGHALFCAQDLTELDKAAALSPAQKQAAESLMKAACLRARQEQSKLTRRFAEQSETLQEFAYESPETYNEHYKTYMADYQKSAAATNKVIAGIERDALSDLMAVLEKPQFDKGWPAFERWRRRLLVDQYGNSIGLGINPRLIFRPLKLSSADTAAAEEALSRYELELDPLLIQRISGIAKLNAEAAQNGDYDPQYWARPELGTAGIRQLNVKTAGAIERLLSEEGRKAFLRQRIGMELNGVYTRPSNDPRVRQITDLPSLTTEQKTRFAELVARADDAVFDMAVAELHERDAAAMKNEADADRQPDEWWRRQQKGAKAASNLAKALRATLTTDQQDELDIASGLNSREDNWTIDRIPVADSEWSPKPALESKPAARPAKSR